MDLNVQLGELSTKLGGYKTILDTRSLNEEETRGFEQAKKEYKDCQLRKAQANDCVTIAEACRADDDEDDDPDADDDEENKKRSNKKAGTTATRSANKMPACSKDYSDVHEYQARRKDYSISRAVGILSEERSLDKTLEGELSKELRRKSGKSTSNSRSFDIPFRMADMNHDAQTEKRARRMEKRTQFDTTSGSGFFETNWANDYIDFLYNIQVAGKLGVTFLSGLHGQLQIPRLTAVPTTYVLGENASATAATPSTDHILLTGRQAIGSVTLTKELLENSSVAADIVLRESLMRSLATNVDAHIISGNPNVESASDYGVLYDPSVPDSNVVTLAASSHLPTWHATTNLASLVAEQNVPIDETSCYLTSPFGAQVLGETAKQTVGQTSNYPKALMEDGLLNGFKVVQSNQVPNNFTYTGVTGHSMSALLFGTWRYVYFAQWGESLTVVVDPYTAAKSMSTIISAGTMFDHALQHGGAVAFFTDMFTD